MFKVSNRVPEYRSMTICIAVPPRTIFVRTRMNNFSYWARANSERLCKCISREPIIMVNTVRTVMMHSAYSRYSNTDEYRY